MLVTINNEAIKVTPSQTLATLLEQYCQQTGLHLSQIAVAQSTTIIPRSEWSFHEPDDGECYTVFSAVAGG